MGRNSAIILRPQQRTACPAECRPASVRTGGERVQIILPRVIGSDHLHFFRLGQEPFEFLQSLFLKFQSLAVTDLVDGEFVGEKEAAVALIPSVAIGDQIEPSQGGGQCQVQIVVKRQELSLAYDAEQSRIPLKLDGPTRLRHA